MYWRYNMTDSVLRAESLKKMIGKKTIVSDLNFELKKGEIFGFLGPNGAGKTTTIRMIVGLSKITEGNIYISGVSVKSDFKKAIREVGCIVENPDLYKYMSGLENLKIFASMYGISESRVKEMIALVGLEKAAGDKVKTYSLGMKQRLGIAQALLHEPKLLVLDEPTNGLDPAGIREMRELLRFLASERGLTVFVSSHILSEMQLLCDRVCIINNGRIVMVKTVDEILAMANSSGNVKLLLKTDDKEKAASLLKDTGMECTPVSDGIQIETARSNVPEIVTTLTSGGISIFGMDSIETQSLEDIFMKLTEEGK